MYNEKEIKEYLINNMSEFRYKHSLMVASEAKNLAIHYNLDSNRAYITGLLHDISKEFKDKDNDYYIEKYNIDNKYTNSKVIHSYVGAYFSKEKYNIDDEMMYAIMYHTLGHPNMNLFAKIILVADKLGRKNADEYLKSLAYFNIDDAVKYIIIKQVNKLKEEGRIPHEDTLNLLKYLK